MKFNEETLSKLKRADEHFDERYGKLGTPSRIVFEKREYIALLEKGETDMQLSTFLNISQALGLKFSLV